MQRMLDDPDTAAEEARPERPYLRSVEVEGIPGLGGKVQLSLEAKATVLVGRNGAGKSLLLNALNDCADEAVFPEGSRHRTGEIRFRCEVPWGDGSILVYEYTRRGVSPDEETQPPEGQPPAAPRVSWDERCWDLNSREEYWRLEGGELRIAGAAALPVPSGVSLLSMRRDIVPTPHQAAILWLVLAGVAFVPAGVPRSDFGQRNEILLTSMRVRSGGRRWRSPARPGRVALISSRLANLSESLTDTFSDFCELAKRLQLAQEVTVTTYNDPRNDIPEGERRDVAVVNFDGTNLGLLSDGTLRVAEILLDLLRAGGSLLLIEEPETAVHPGLLSRVLALLESYATDRQIVISTHSPLVVDWCPPAAVRLVTREKGATQTMPLSVDEVRNVRAYLNDEGTFGDYIFGQSSD